MHHPCLEPAYSDKESARHDRKKKSQEEEEEDGEEEVGQKKEHFSIFSSACIRHVIIMGGGSGPSTPSGPIVLSEHGVSVGSFVMVDKRPPTGQPVAPEDREWHRAEILSIRGSGISYYVHFDGFNKRLDEWVKPRI
ncbi:hypothetical protein BC830DRAFT_893769 [Chytriomyces sp. MP71]|nr:hypothetical protein BC830DRAFT_893769 [Chytriomyces sp. MP71]